MESPNPQGNQLFQRIARAAACLIACAAIALSAAQPAAARLSPKRALADLNAMRAAAGEPRVGGLSRRLNRGCRMHNRYMNATGQFGHTESRTSAYYTRSGARAAADSVIAQPSALPSQAWGNSVYHRLALLQPRLRRSGYSANYGFACLQVLSGVSDARSARTRAVSLYSWPPNGATGVDPSFDGSEYPDPSADAPGAEDLGAPITVNVNGPWRHWLLTRTNITSASLVSDAGELVPLSISDMSASNAAFLQGGFALLPRGTLATNMGYTANARGYVNNNGRSWRFALNVRFTTGSSPGF